MTAVVETPVFSLLRFRAMFVSVALCTYNGAKHLPQQLASIAAQTRQPDEVVVCDDGSTDSTRNIVGGFRTNSPFPVRLSINEKNLGSTQNFARAIDRCQGDVIVLSDQDDVWSPSKIAVLTETLSRSPQAGFVFSDAVIVDEGLRPFGYTLWEALRLNGRERRRMEQEGAFEVLLRRFAVTGATMAFRSKFNDLILPIPPSWIHDGWIALLISAVAGCALVETPLIQYRQHARQQIGETKRNLFQQFQIARKMDRTSYQKVVEAFSAAKERLAGTSAYAVRPELLDQLEDKIVHFQSRTQMRDRGAVRLPIIWRELAAGRYQRYSLGWKSLAQDLFL